MWFFVFWISLVSAAPKGWSVVGTKDNIEVARKTIEGSPLFAFRGETISDVDAAILASILLDDPLATQWVDLMNISKQIRRLNSNEKLVHQGYDMPWPITDRDFVMNQTAKLIDLLLPCSPITLKANHKRQKHPPS